MSKTGSLSTMCYMISIVCSASTTTFLIMPMHTYMISMRQGVLGQVAQEIGVKVLVEAAFPIIHFHRLAFGYLGAAALDYVSHPLYKR